MFPGTPLTPDAIHLACREVFAPPNQRKRVIFFQTGELVQFLPCTRNAAIEEINTHSWEEGQGRGVRLLLSPEVSCWMGSVLSCNFPAGLFKKREDVSVHRGPKVPSRGISFPSEERVSLT